MSSFLLRQRLEAEAAGLKNLIDTVSPDDILGLFSLRSRLEEVSEELTQMVNARATRAEVTLIFNGSPVVGAEAIDASFGSRAIDQFQRIISTAFATQAGDGNIGQRGPTASSDLAALHITGLVHGSFGFVLEEIDPKGEQWVASALKVASDSAVSALEAVSALDSNKADSALEDINERMFSNIRDFIELIYDNHAVITLAERNRAVELDAAALERAYQRVANAEIIDEEITLVGTLQGVLPGARRFEFEGEGISIKGRVARDISAEYLKTLESSPMVGHPITGVFRKRVVRDSTSNLRESYLLTQVATQDGASSHIV